MKTLEQLGISPAPWKVDDREFGCDNEISCEYISDIIVKGGKRTKVVARCNAHFDTYKPDAILIAAAPKLYAAKSSSAELLSNVLRRKARERPNLSLTMLPKKGAHRTAALSSR